MRVTLADQMVLAAALALFVLCALFVAARRAENAPIAPHLLSSSRPPVPFANEGMKPSIAGKGSAADQARKLNAAVQFAANPGAAAQPFRLTQNTSDRNRAIDCLAIAAMAEAGDGDDGQRAVIQVILNRVRHPAFAKTVCGVVFEGSQRATGCQFTFTCDGALARRHGAAAWSRARLRAGEALGGRVYSPVGVATHYHTDWVHPYWSSSLTKLARVETHLFFRWPGKWGDLAALNAVYRGNEPSIMQLAYLPAHIGDEEGALLGGLDGANESDNAVLDIIVRNSDGGAFVLFTGAPSVERARNLGRTVCAGSSSCKVFAWFDRIAIPSSYPVSAASRGKLAFSYYRSAGSDEIILYDCARFSNVANDQCLPPPIKGRQPQRTASVAAPTGQKPRIAEVRSQSAQSVAGPPKS